ncbi:MAG TPA: hypothetical protein VLB51_14005 [Methylomirabilota bacterium]|nr:hypothetical protein [Methylomirabilota bacterium]
MANRTTTVTLVVSDDERRALDRMHSRPEEPGATEGPLRIEAIQDVHISDRGTVVQVEVANAGAEGDSAEVLEERLRRHMARISTTRDAERQVTPKDLISG